MSKDRRNRCRALAATIGMQADIGGGMAESVVMSPLREAVKKACAISSPRLASMV